MLTGHYHALQLPGVSTQGNQKEGLTSYTLSTHMWYCSAQVLTHWGAKNAYSDHELETMGTHLGSLSPHKADFEYSFTFGKEAAQIGTPSTHIGYSEYPMDMDDIL